MNEKKIFAKTTFDIKKIVEEYCRSDSRDTITKELIISVDSRMDQVYGLAVIVHRDEMGSAKAYYSLFKARYIGDLDFKAVNKFIEIEYDDIENYALYDSTTEYEFLKRFFVNIIQITFDYNEIDRKLKGSNR